MHVHIHVHCIHIGLISEIYHEKGIRKHHDVSIPRGKWEIIIFECVVMRRRNLEQGEHTQKYTSNTRVYVDKSVSQSVSE